MTILLIGRCGDLGTGRSPLVQALERHGHDVVIFSGAEFRGPVFHGAKKKIIRSFPEGKPDLALLDWTGRHALLFAGTILHQFRIPVFFIVRDLSRICPADAVRNANGTGGRFRIENFHFCAFFRHIGGAAANVVFRLCGISNRIDLYLAPSFFVKIKLEQSSFTRSPILLLRDPLPLRAVSTPPASSGKYFLYFGRLSPGSGVDTLLRAMELLAAEGAVRLLIAGDGPQRRELEKTAAEHKLPVLFFSFPTDEFPRHILANSRCVIFPSEQQENRPASVTGAMAFGRPVIVSNPGGLSELVEDGKNGFVFRSGNPRGLCRALRKMWDLSGREYERICRNALETARSQYDTDRYADKIEELYAVWKRTEKAPYGTNPVHKFSSADEKEE